LVTSSTDASPMYVPPVICPCMTIVPTQEANLILADYDTYICRR